MSACCACAKCQCLCHRSLTTQDYHRMTQEALLGERLERVATRWHTNTLQLRQIIAHTCFTANPTRYRQQREGGGKVLEQLRIYATDYGFEAAPKYAAWRREREETPDA
jgi:hypothetical protein